LINPQSCQGQITNIDITFHGDVIDEILDLFKGVIGDMVKSKLSPIICNEVGLSQSGQSTFFLSLNNLFSKIVQLTNVLQTVANPLLQKIPISIPIADGFALDYSVVDAPIANTNTITAGFLGRVW
jgi:hypothetical protein